MLGKLLKNCEGIEKHQFCLWSGKVASKAKEAELAEKAKKMHTVEVAGIYIPYMDPMGIDDHQPIDDVFLIEEILRISEGRTNQPPSPS